MNTIPVKSIQGNYSIKIGSGLLEKTGKILISSGVLGKKIMRGKTKVLVVSQKPVSKHYGARVCTSLGKAGLKVFMHLLPDGERAKSQEELFRLFHKMLLLDFERSDLLLALGGGVAGDLSGFAASTYLRGVSFINVATTLLAQVDSSIGGKTAINLAEGKNLIGTFYPPRVVISDVNTLTTLPEREYRASLAEVVKCAVIQSKTLFDLLEKNIAKIHRRDKRLLERVVRICAAVKAGVVSRDEKETKGERMFLNYGHTFGHAFERLGRYQRLLHGEAVSLGMCVAARLAVKEGLLDIRSEKRQSELLSSLGLPVSSGFLKFKTKAVYEAMRHDKKKKSGKLRFVIPVRIGKVIVSSDFDRKRVCQAIGETGGRP